MTIIPLVTIVSGSPQSPTIFLPGKTIDLDDYEARRLVNAEFAIQSESSQPISDSNEFIESIVDVIAELPKSGFGKDGKPNVKALQTILEFEVSASQRDAAWEKFQHLTKPTS